MKTSEQHLYILRAWSENGRWRWSLLSEGSSERIGFPDLDSLYLYLSSLTQESNEQTQNPDLNED